MYDLICDWPAMMTFIPPQGLRPCGTNPALVACTETESYIMSFKPLFPNTPSTHDTEKLLAYAMIDFESSTLSNSIP